MEHIIESLIENSKSAMIGCIEMHNKPVFPYRYEVCTILAINSWELLLKAYILQNFEDVRVINEDGTSKPFDECLSFVASQNEKTFRVTEENLRKIYEFRCNIIHFYDDHIGVILYSLLHKTILFYNKFLKTNFNIDLTEESNLMLLPIGFKPFATPIDFLTNKSEIEKTSDSVKTFIKSIIVSTKALNEEGFEESILLGFNMAVFNENRIKNADIIAGITKDDEKAKLKISTVLNPANITSDENAKKYKIEEQTLFKTIYTIPYYMVIKRAREMFSDFLQNQKFNKIMKSLKENPKFHKKRFLDAVKNTGQGKDWYTNEIFNELSKYYKLRES